MGNVPIQQTNKTNLNKNIDINICGIEKGKNTIQPISCNQNAKNLKMENSNMYTDAIYNMKLPDLPVNQCIPLFPKTGIKLEKDKTYESINHSKYVPTLCTHNYIDKDTHKIREEIMFKMGNNYLEKNMETIAKLKKMSEKQQEILRANINDKSSDYHTLMKPSYTNSIDPNISYNFIKPMKGYYDDPINKIKKPDYDKSPSFTKPKKQETPIKIEYKPPSFPTTRSDVYRQKYS